MRLKIYNNTYIQITNTKTENQQMEKIFQPTNKETNNQANDQPNTEINKITSRGNDRG